MPGAGHGQPGRTCLLRDDAAGCLEVEQRPAAPCRPAPPVPARGGSWG